MQNIVSFFLSLRRSWRWVILSIFLAACGESRENMLRELEQLEAYNVADTLMSSYFAESERLAKWFDDHGSSNERMRAHYILGRAYADLGEAPYAIDSYLNAISCADTTAEDRNYQKMKIIYSQMAYVYYGQLLFTNDIDARKHALYYACLSGDTLSAIAELKLIASPLILLNRKDSAEKVLNEAIRQYYEAGFKQQALEASIMLMHIYAEDEHRSDDLKRLIDTFDAECNLFDENRNLPSAKRQYFYYKGMYFDHVNQLDSAEYYYRKVSRPNMSIVSKVPLYKGLLSVYGKRHIPDSVDKYSLLYCTANDSSLAVRDQDITARMAASYQYNRFQKEAFKNEEKARNARIRLYVLLIISFALIVIGIVGFTSFKRKQRRETERMKAEYAEATEKYNKNLHAINVLENSHKEVIAIIQEELDNAKGERLKFREKYYASLSAIEELNNKYEAETTELKIENVRLQELINVLKQSKDLSTFVETSKEFFNSDIARLILHRVEKSQFMLSEEEWSELAATANKCFPAMVNDLNRLVGMTQQKQRVCILGILQLRTSDIAYFLNVTPQRITNMRMALNSALFNENTARSLNMNIIQKYNIIA
jgi:hypothetical protein